MISALHSGAIRVSRIIGVPPTRSARLVGMREFSLPFGTCRTLSACALQTTAGEPVGGLERGQARLLRLLQEHSHRLLDPGGATASLGRLVPLQLERHVDDAAGICDEVGRVENA